MPSEVPPEFASSLRRPATASSGRNHAASSNPFVGSHSVNPIFRDAKELLGAFTSAMVLELSTKRQHLFDHLRSFDPDVSGQLPIDTAVSMLAETAMKWTPHVAYATAEVQSAIRTLKVFDQMAGPGMVGITNLFYMLTATDKMRRALAESVMYNARKRADRLRPADFARNPVLIQLPADFFRLRPSQLDRDTFTKTLGALLPPTDKEWSVQPCELDMCWETLVQDEKAGRLTKRALHGGRGREFYFAAAWISISPIFQLSLTFSIVLNAVSMMLDDPLCEPVDAIGSHLCIFNCVSVLSALDGYTCNVDLELVRAKIEFCVLVAFTVEMTLLLVVQQYQYFLDPWNIFDFVVIGLSWVSVFVELPSVAVIRLVKLLRLLRMFKTYKALQVHIRRSACICLQILNACA